MNPSFTIPEDITSTEGQRAYTRGVLAGYPAGYQKGQGDCLREVIKNWNRPERTEKTESPTEIDQRSTKL